MRILYVRLDSEPGVNFGIEFEDGPAKVEAARGRIVEMRVDLPAPHQGKRFRVTVARDGLPVVTVPEQGWIELS